MTLGLWQTRKVWAAESCSGFPRLPSRRRKTSEIDHRGSPPQFGASLEGKVLTQLCPLRWPQAYCYLS